LENESSKLAERTLLAATEVRSTILAAIDAVLARPGPSRNIALEVSEQPIFVHRDDLLTIVDELVDNARKFSGLGTEITVHLERIGKLTVTDHGRGMTGEQIRQIGAFQQFDRHQHAQQGLGLGLFLVKKLAERNGAKLVIESEPGQGTSVSITFATAH